MGHIGLSNDEVLVRVYWMSGFEAFFCDNCNVTCVLLKSYRFVKTLF